jgi:exodeoxyribonuclease V alpha subunit
VIALPSVADPFDIRRVGDARGMLRDFNDAGVLAAADVHVAFRLAQLAAEQDEWVWLAAALAVRSPRLGHVYADLATIRETVAVDAEEPVDLAALAWPPPAEWPQRVAASPLVTVGEDDAAAGAPLRLVGTSLYLDRYWREERQVSADLRALSEQPADGVRDDVLAAGLGRLFAGQPDTRQRLAAASAVLRRFAVVAGGPGTGKTTTVARIVALLAEQAAAAGAPQPLVALAAPTGKAAARLEEAVHEAATRLDVADAVRAHLLALSASTLHRLLGRRPDSHSRFRHHRGNRLPHDVVIVDETSMVSLSLMARLAEAIRPEARLVLVGDPGQLTSIEAGAVLADVVGPAADRLLMRPAARARLAQATGDDFAAGAAPDGATVGDGIVVLDTVHRFGPGIARVAEAIRRGDADAVLEALAGGPGDVTWLPVDVGDPAAQGALAPVRDGAVSAARVVVQAARDGAAEEAIAGLGAFRILCAHRRGPHGVATWLAHVEGWLGAELDGFGADGDWYAGRPLLVTENDYGLRLYNGDTGVVVATPGGGVTAAFERRGHVFQVRPGRLAAVDTVYAMTVHKSQGSQFGTAAVLLPAPASRVLTRELLYTAVTRARKHLIVAGTEETIRAAVARPAVRASGLRRRLWSEAP